MPDIVIDKCRLLVRHGCEVDNGAWSSKLTKE